MGKTNDAMISSAWTSGAGIAIGTAIDIGGIICSANVTVKDADDTILVAPSSISLNPPIAVTGPITATSSANSFCVIYRER